MTKYRATTQCEINAPINRVWQIMTGIENYGAWNPFVVSIESPSATPTVGTTMRFSVRFPNQKRTIYTAETVTVFQPPNRSDEHQGLKTALWAYRYADFASSLGLIRATRTQQLTETASGGTHYFTEERFSGLAVRFVPLAAVQAGFEAQAEALRHAAESPD